MKEDMYNKNKTTSKEYIFYILRRVALVIFDIVAINVASYLALLLRFFERGHGIEKGIPYISAYNDFAVAYTLCCVVIFALFKLYSGIWRYAGINDLNRIIKANAITFIVNVVGTLVFIRRMPISYYGLSIILQFIFVASGRFGYRLCIAEVNKAAGRRLKRLHIMVIGADENSRAAIKFIERDSDMSSRPVCFIDANGNREGLLLEGIPVHCGLENLKEHINRYKVDYVVIADADIDINSRKKVCDICRELDVRVNDFTMVVHKKSGGVALKEFLPLISGEVVIKQSNVEEYYDSGIIAEPYYSGKYVVSEVTQCDGRIVVSIEEMKYADKNLDDWAKEYENMTGEVISFF